jgi:RHS repeat-associated protein
MHVDLSMTEFYARASRYTGKERDTESGNDYFGARYYASSMGRWLSPDKPFADQHAQNPQSWNLYAYARNNPLTVFDPNGEAAVVLVNGNNVTIFFPVSFSGNANTAANQAAYTAAITSAWTGQFGNYNTTMHVVPGDPGGPLTNDVHINAPTPADGAFPRPTTDVGGPNMNLFGLGDNAAQNKYETWASGHETGHGMGEQDQYNDATGPNPGYEHNIMGAVNGTPDARDINNVLTFHGNTVINITPSTPLSTETTTLNQTIPLIQPPQLQLQP